MQQAFDTVAQSYDASFTHSVIGIAQRNVIWSYLESNVSSNDELNILELNCGTGEDALWFAKKGHKVLATDISEKMLEITQEKIHEANLLSRVQTKQIDIRKIDSAGIKQKFNLVFSNFGGMNCISLKEMEKLPSEIKKLLIPNGQLIMVVMPAFCLWETIYFLLKLNFSKAFRRYSDNGTIAKLNGNEMRTFYFSPGKIKKIFGHNFEVVAVKPIGFFIPPSYLDNFFSSKAKLFSFLEKLEHAVTKFSFLAGFSDHYLIDLQVKE
jgi:ubiquinone/menaquinone biosynthesis C-methylase UbiE